VKQLIIAIVLGGLTLFVWGAISHTVLPVSGNAFLRFTNEDAVTQTIIANAPKSGVYFMPYVPQTRDGRSEEEFKKEQDKAQEKIRRGPFMLAAVRLHEMGSFGNYLAVQLLTDILTAFFVCLVLAKGKDPSFWNVVASTEFMGLAGFAALSLPQWNWYAFSDAFTFAELFDVVAGFFLAGLVIASIIRRKPSTAT